MKYLFANNASSALVFDTAAISTTLTVQTGHGASFPQPVGDNSDGFPVTVEDRRFKQLEICWCTSRVGDILTVLRGQEGTLPLDFKQGASVSHRTTAKTLVDLQNLAASTLNYTKAESDAKFVWKAGDSMSGPLGVVEPTQEGHATSKGYVDENDLELANAVSTKEPTIAAGNPAYVWYGDKQWKPLTTASLDVYTKAESDFNYVNIAGDSMTGGLSIDASVNSTLKINGPDPNNESALHFNAMGVKRWTIERNMGNEAGSNTGSDISITRWSDGQVNLGKVLEINRATGITDFKVNPTVNGLPISVGAEHLTVIADAAPTAIVDNQMWWQSNTGFLFIRYNDGTGPPQFVQVNSSAGMVGEAPLDGQDYVRKTGGWAVAGSTSGFVTEAPADGQGYLRKGSTAGWVPGLQDAPTDGQSYVRKSGAWTVAATFMTTADGDARYVNVTGDSMSGGLTMAGSLQALDVTATRNMATSYISGASLYFTSAIMAGGYVITGNDTGNGGGVLGYSGGSYGIVGYNYNYSFYGNNVCYASQYQGSTVYVNSTIQSINGKGIFGGTTTTASSANCNITTGGGLYRSTASSLAVKKDVEPLWDEVGDAILKLRPLWHRYKINTRESNRWSWYSFGAEEVAAVDPHFAAYDHAVVFDSNGNEVFDYKDEEHPDPEDATKTIIKRVPTGIRLADKQSPQHINWNAVTTALVNLVQRLERRIAVLEGQRGL